MSKRLPDTPPQPARQRKPHTNALGLPEGAELERVKVLGEDWPPEGFGVGDPAQGPFNRSGAGVSQILSIELVGRRIVMETGGQPGQPTHVETYPVEHCGAKAKLAAPETLLDKLPHARYTPGTE